MELEGPWERHMADDELRGIPDQPPTGAEWAEASVGVTFAVTVLVVEHDALGTGVEEIQVSWKWWAKEFGHFIGNGKSLKLNDWQGHWHPREKNYNFRKTNMAWIHIELGMIGRYASFHWKSEVEEKSWR